MLIMNFHDAVSEADGYRLRRQWKIMLLFFVADGRSSSKYQIEVHVASKIYINFLGNI